MHHAVSNMHMWFGVLAMAVVLSIVMGFAAHDFERDERRTIMAISFVVAIICGAILIASR